MTLTTASRLTAILGLGMAAYLGGPSAFSPVLGIAPADAKGFYTRKRVNGAWVEGRFPKGGSGRSASRSRGRAVAKAAVVARTAAIAPLPLPPRPEREAAPDASAVTASLGTDRMSKLHSALQAKAQAIAAAPAEPVRPPVASPATPRSVTFDFETGFKTTHFGGGVTVREPFDAVALRPLASPPPGVSTPALSAGLPAGPVRPDSKSPDRLPGS